MTWILELFKCCINMQQVLSQFYHLLYVNGRSHVFCLRQDELERRFSMMEIPELPQFNKKLSALEELEMQQKERRDSMQNRRMSLFDAIPDFPNLKKRKSPPKVHTCLPEKYGK